MSKRSASVDEIVAAIEAARDKVMSDEVKSLTKLGIHKAMAYLDGDQLQGRLNLDGSVTPRTWALPIVYEQQLRLLRSSFPALVADAVQSEVEAQAPAALAELFSRAIARMASL